MTLKSFSLSAFSFRHCNDSNTKQDMQLNTCILYLYMCYLVFSFHGKVQNCGLINGYTHESGIFLYTKCQNGCKYYSHRTIKWYHGDIQW